MLKEEGIEISSSDSESGLVKEKIKKLSDSEAKDIAKLLGERIVAINYKVGQKLKKLRANEEKINI